MAASRAARLAGHLRVVHPFPSVLDGIVAGGAAWLAGGAGETAARLAISMILLQASVGALNDVVDAPRDAGRKPGKPIPAGLVEARVALTISAVAAAAGLLLAVPSGPATLGLAVVLLALGYGYDLLAKGTAWSWVPFAIAIPLFPTYGWLGAAGTVPPVWPVLLVVAALAGAGLAIGNGVVDLERDRDAGLASAATVLGHARAVWLEALLIVAAAAAAVGVLWARSAIVPGGVAIAAGLGLALGGARLLAAARPATRERGWEFQAVGIAVAAIGWLAGLAAVGG
ncbi:MAG TPA: UbiA family prenyltransferase, partial [Clostridia bacterium]|nr:UbiA family prenyltransferase [Clostridia bacterium]